ncbi:MAG TPA: hypothetical protein DD727_02920 [Clostridiales bacterium]|nr:hypothetical protein [Clostridiales bacterium]
MPTGFNHRRLSMLLAVLERRGGIRLHDQDTYVNVVGGIKLLETSCDLGIVTAIASAWRDTPVTAGTVVLGEVGLSGEIRSVANIGKRIMEASRLGFTRCLIPAGNARDFQSFENGRNIPEIQVIGVANLQSALKEAFQPGK